MFTLNIFHAITEIITHPSIYINAAESENITLTCLASIDGVAYSWHRVDGSIPLQSLHSDDHTFIIPQITPHDAGIYYCMASKEGIVVKSGTSTVVVNGKEYSYYLCQHTSIATQLLQSFVSLTINLNDNHKLGI